MNPIRPGIAALEPSGIIKVAQLGFGDPGIIPLWLGETDLVTPKFIRDAAACALEEGRTFYTHSRGIPPLREAIRDFHRRVTGADIAPDRITVPGSAMLAVTSALSAVAEDGGNIVIVSPVWPNIFQAAKIARQEPRLVRLAEDWDAGRWRLDLDRLFDACDGNTRALFLASPGNPSGWMLTADEQKTILEFARKRGIAIIGDEVYGTLVYDGAAHAPSWLSLAEPDDAVFVINSFSKPWAMTGWRIGWLVHPASLAVPMVAITQAGNTGATHFLQYGALAALSAEGDAFRAQLLDRCRKGRDVVARFVERQNRIRWMKPDGAFYGFLNIGGLKDSLAFAQELVRRAKVGVAPGSAFGLGDVRDDAYVRICFAQDAARVAEGLSRLEGALAAV